ncbi:MAG: hypothetical protein CVT48_02465 [Thermoplasmata archaeon HGW-Thermoplasmata-1]|nr:MAG: hypothetical protein CVT48_02465 [Thermoplasmata archaeon HGW-Thermoplasmata-1]
MTKIKIALVSANPALGNKEANIEIMKRHVFESGADIIAFPETFLTGYGGRRVFCANAEDENGPSIQLLKEWAREKRCCIIFGAPLKHPDPKKRKAGILVNAGVMVQPSGEVNVQYKNHLPNFGPFSERRFFEPFDGTTVFDTPLGKVGIIICYDLFFPEVAKSLALKGADMLFNITCSPMLSKNFFEAVLPARAIENTCFVGFANIVGQQNKLEFWGGPQLYGPAGDLKIRGDYMTECRVEYAIDLKELQERRKLRPTLSDSRPFLFADISGFLKKRERVRRKKDKIRATKIKKSDSKPTVCDQVRESTHLCPQTSEFADSTQSQALRTRTAREQQLAYHAKTSGANEGQKGEES